MVCWQGRGRVRVQIAPGSVCRESALVPTNVPIEEVAFVSCVHATTELALCRSRCSLSNHSSFILSVVMVCPHGGVDGKHIVHTWGGPRGLMLCRLHELTMSWKVMP